MLKNICQLEYKINERVYHFTCDNDSPLEHIKEVLFQFQKYIGQIEDAAKAEKEKTENGAAEKLENHLDDNEAVIENVDQQ